MSTKLQIGDWVKTNEFYRNTAKKFNKNHRQQKMPLSIAGRVTEIREFFGESTIKLDSYSYAIRTEYLEEWEINVSIGGRM